MSTFFRARVGAFANDQRRADLQPSQQGTAADSRRTIRSIASSCPRRPAATSGRGDVQRCLSFPPHLPGGRVARGAFSFDDADQLEIRGIADRGRDLRGHLHRGGRRQRPQPTRTWRARPSLVRGRLRVAKINNVGAHRLDTRAYDSDGDGRPDTYVRGDTILIDVEFDAGQPVVIGQRQEPCGCAWTWERTTTTAGGTAAGCSPSPALRVGGRRGSAFRLQGRRQPTADADGVWVQTGGWNQVLVLVGDTTLTHVGQRCRRRPDVAPACRRRATRWHMVDGSKTSTNTDTGPRPTAA